MGISILQFKYLPLVNVSTLGRQLTPLIVLLFIGTMPSYETFFGDLPQKCLFSDPCHLCGCMSTHLMLKSQGCYHLVSVPPLTWHGEVPRNLHHLAMSGCGEYILIIVWCIASVTLKIFILKYVYHILMVCIQRLSLWTVSPILWCHSQVCFLWHNTSHWAPNSVLGSLLQLLCCKCICA